METLPATSWSPPVHMGALSQAQESAIHANDATATTCATRLTIFRSPSSRSIKSSTRSSSGLSLSSLSSPRSLAFPLAQRIGRTPSGSFGPDPFTQIEEQTSVTRPRVPTKFLHPHEVQAELHGLSSEVVASPMDMHENRLAAPNVASVGIPGANSASDSGAELEPLELTPLADEHFLPFADRQEEVWALVTHPCNAALKGRLERLSSGTIWPELQKKLKESRLDRPDTMWVADLEKLVKTGGRDVAAWVQLRGVLGADDIGYVATPYDHEGLHISAFDEGESVLNASIASPSGASTLGMKLSKTPTKPIVQQSNALGLVGALGLARRSSMDSVFFSDSGSDAGGPHSPGSGGAFGMTPSHPVHPVAMSPLSPLDGSNTSTSPTRARHHPRSRSHGGAVAAGGAIMESIHEDEVLDSPERAAPLSRAHSSGSMKMRQGEVSRMMGLRISALTPRTTASALPDDTDTASRGSGQEREGDHEPVRRKGRLRYSFGAVDAERMGLGLGVDAES